MKSDADPIAIFDRGTYTKRKHFFNQKYEYEDVLDYAHRLAEMGQGPESISERTGFQVDSVRYWMERNGYA